MYNNNAYSKEIPIAQVVGGPTDESSILLDGLSGDRREQVLSSPLHELNATQYLTLHEWPIALQNAFLRNLARIPFRFFIIDDSGSMATSDGHRLIGRGHNKKMVSCTRWSELTDAVRFHAGFAEAAHAKSEFRLLNRSEPILLGTGNSSGSYHELLSLLDGSPGGPTPLCRHIAEVVHSIRMMEAELRATGQRVVVVIATDGESSDGDIVSAMRPLQQLPVWVVIRLCTDEDRVCDYWNGIDKVLELNLDILDDLSGEAKEVNRYNSWLAYGEPLHRMREFGTSIKEFDLLDEARLSGDQILTVVAMILGGSPSDYPHPEVDWPAFVAALKAANSREQQVWNPVKRAATPWILPERLGRYFGRNDICGFCALS